MSMLGTERPDYDDFRDREDVEEVRTKQAFRDAADINKILQKAQREGTIAHLQKYDERVYGEFQGYDLLEAHSLVTKAQTIFDELPSEIRREFEGDALKFAGFASDPANIDRLAEIFPAIARPGDYFPNPVAAGRGGAAAATPESTAPAVDSPPPGQTGDIAPEGGADASTGT